MEFKPTIRIDVTTLTQKEAEQSVTALRYGLQQAGFKDVAHAYGDYIAPTPAMVSDNEPIEQSALDLINQEYPALFDVRVEITATHTDTFNKRFLAEIEAIREARAKGENPAADTITIPRK